MKSKIISKSFLIFAMVILMSKLSAQVVYTDPEPNIVISNSWNTTVTYNLDINNDFITDIKLFIYNFWASYRCYLEPQNNTEVIYSGTYASKLNEYDTIGPFGNWSNANLNFADAFGDSATGIWANVKNKFVGVRIISGNDSLYGWIRMDISINLNMQITIRDYAINTLPNQPIIAGGCILPKAENVSICDVGNNKNGSDLLVNFEKTIDEAKVNEYRIIVVKGSESSSFTLDSAEQVLQGNYIHIIPNGTDFSDTLLPNSKDKNGDFIQEFIPYKVFVLTIVDGVFAIQNCLSLPSNTITLSSPATVASNVMVATTYQGNSSYLINVSFNKIPDESVISEYRIIFLKTTLTGTFNNDSASLIPLGGYYSVAPAGTNIQFNFNSDTLNDYSSNFIEHLVSYKVYILSVADGVFANVNVLSSPSAGFILSSPATAVQNILAEDITNNGNASDMYIIFDTIPNEFTISSYRIFGVKLADCDSFNLNACDSVLPGNYFQVNCYGSNINTLLPFSARDKDGNSITENVPYRFFVLSMADKIHTDVNTLSKPSNIISLSTPNYFKASQKTGTGVFYHDIDPDSVLSENYQSSNSNENYVFDLNNDGVSDFNIHTERNSSSGGTWKESTIQTLNNNSISVVCPGCTNPDTLRFGNMINNDLYWNKGLFIFGKYSGTIEPNSGHSYGIWWNVYDKYAGLRVITSYDTIYGWIRLSVTPPKVIVKDFAWYYRTTNIESTDFISGVDVYPNPANKELQISLNSVKGKGNLKIYDTKGDIVKTSAVENKFTNNSIHIDIHDLSEGLYFVNIIINNKVYNRKFVKMK